MTVEQMLDMTCMALGGRAAEQVMLGKISTGEADKHRAFFWEVWFQTTLGMATIPPDSYLVFSGHAVQSSTCCC